MMDWHIWSSIFKQGAVNIAGFDYAEVALFEPPQSLQRLH